jgi:hypothetical protein
MQKVRRAEISRRDGALKYGLYAPRAVECTSTSAAPSSFATGGAASATRGGSIAGMTRQPRCQLLALAGRLWFPGPASRYSQAQREAIGRLFRARVDRDCAAVRRCAGWVGRPRPG